MKFSRFCLVATISASSFIVATVTGSTNAVDGLEIPFITPKVMYGGTVHDVEIEGGEFSVATVEGCCEDNYTPRIIGEMPQMNEEQTKRVLEDAKQAWNGGMGTWPQMSLKERWNAIDNFLRELSLQRELIVQTLMWEIGKNRMDAETEFDRTVEFCRKVMEIVQTDTDYVGGWQTIGSTKAFVRRAAVGIIMCLGPMNYPLNETYATLIPALLMGNVAIMKIPTVGGLAHLLTSKSFP
jgi:acyl-CoA reductase-like NAD-dependent aldehyde dehydrogenase